MTQRPECNGSALCHDTTPPIARVMRMISDTLLVPVCCLSLFVTIGCSAEKKWLSDNETSVENACFVVADESTGFVCVNATPEICEYRVGVSFEASCAVLDMAACENGTWTQTSCPGDEGGACIWVDNMSNTPVCVDANRGECLLYAEADGHWHPHSCPENGYDTHCGDVNIWVEAGGNCVSEFMFHGSCMVYDELFDDSYCFTDTLASCTAYEGIFHENISCGSIGFNYLCDDHVLYSSEEACFGY